MDGDVSLLLSIFIASITAIATTVLVWVTRRYAIATDRILGETQKDRETKWIEHQLRDLYQPIAEVMRKPSTLQFYLQIGALADVQVSSKTQPVIRIKDKLYLCDEKLRNLIKKLMQTETSSPKGAEEYRKLHEQIVAHVTNEIDYLTKRLHELNTSQKK